MIVRSWPRRGPGRCRGRGPGPRPGPRRPGRARARTVQAQRPGQPRQPGRLSRLDPELGLVAHRAPSPASIHSSTVAPGEYRAILVSSVSMSAANRHSPPPCACYVAGGLERMGEQHRRGIGAGRMTAPTSAQETASSRHPAACSPNRARHARHHPAACTRALPWPAAGRRTAPPCHIGGANPDTRVSRPVNGGSSLIGTGSFPGPSRASLVTGFGSQ